MKKILKKVGSGIVKGAHVVNKVTGGTQLADYAGGKLAKTFSKNKQYVKETTTKAQAINSAKKVAVTTALVGSMGLGRVANAAIRGGGAAKKAIAVKKVPTQFLRNDIPGTKGYAKGRVRGRKVR